MKKIVILLSVAILFASAAKADSAVGSSLGTLTTARVLEEKQGMAGLGVGVGGGDDRNSVAGWLTYGIFEYTDITGKIGIADADEARVVLGAEFKYQLMDAGSQLHDPFDLSIGGFFEYIDEVFQIGAHVTGSKAYLLDNQQVLAPYGRFNVRLEDYDSDSNVEFGLTGGVRWGITRNISLFGELQLDGNEAIFLGIRDSIF